MTSMPTTAQTQSTKKVGRNSAPEHFIGCEVMGGKVRYGECHKDVSGVSPKRNVHFFGGVS